MRAWEACLLSRAWTSLSRRGHHHRLVARETLLAQKNIETSDDNHRGTCEHRNRRHISEYEIAEITAQMIIVYW